MSTKLSTFSLTDIVDGNINVDGYLVKKMNILKKKKVLNFEVKPSKMLKNNQHYLI